MCVRERMCVRECMCVRVCRPADPYRPTHRPRQLNIRVPRAFYPLTGRSSAPKHAEEAVFYYQRAHRFNHAVRLAKENNMSSELTMLALQAERSARTLGGITQT
eukprot:6179074-Pleurochrysis_carterae.AAC.1